jgi:nucleoside-diphosphate-sugar epimerase
MGDRQDSGPRGHVLLAGAAGFLGSHLADRLLHDGFAVVGVDNLVTGRLENLDHIRDHPRFRLVTADIIDPLTERGPFDWVFHFASPASPPRYLAHPLATLRANAEGTWRLLELARETGARFLLASTSEVYGDPTVHPQDEAYRGNVSAVGARSVYAEGKRYAEALTTSVSREHGVDVRIVRIFNTYGPRMDPADGRVVTNFVVQALRGEPLTIYGDGHETRSFQYVDDLVEGIRRMMDVDHRGPVNLGSPVEHSVRELAESVIALTGSASTIEIQPLRPDDPRRRCPDITLARRLLRWEPVVPLHDGLIRTIDHLRPRVVAAGDLDLSARVARSTTL